MYVSVCVFFSFFVGCVFELSLAMPVKAGDSFVQIAFVLVSRLKYLVTQARIQDFGQGGPMEF